MNPRFSIFFLIIYLTTHRCLVAGDATGGTSQDKSDLPPRHVATIIRSPSTEKVGETNDTYIEVKEVESNSVVQKLRITEFQGKWSENTVEQQDYDFDGFRDIRTEDYIFTTSDRTCRYWFYNPATGLYEPDDRPNKVSERACFLVDEVKRTLSIESYQEEMDDATDLYQWKNGELELVSRTASQFVIEGKKRIDSEYKWTGEKFELISKRESPYEAHGGCE